MRNQRSVALLLFGMACAENAENRQVEAIVLPPEPAEWGVAVGVQTIDYDGERLEVWYPAVANTPQTETERVSFSGFLPEIFSEHLGRTVELPELETRAVRDAPLRLPESPVPVVVFSHGFGGMRLQSLGLTSHLASRGYVVVAPDHPGRMLTDVLPCLFSPTLDGCDLSGFADDPAIDDIDTVLEWIADASTQTGWRELMDAERIGLFGHSAGANSTTAVGDEDDRFRALVPMAGGGAVRRDVPVLRIDASCDGFVPSADESVLDTMTDGQFVQIHGGGHLAFTDLCDLDLGTLADDYIGPRDDANATLLPQLRKLAVDGCPGEPPLVTEPGCEEDFLALDVSHEIVRFYLTQFFDEHLADRVPAGLVNPFDEATMWSK